MKIKQINNKFNYNKINLKKTCKYLIGIGIFSLTFYNHKIELNEEIKPNYRLIKEDISNPITNDISPILESNSMKEESELQDFLIQEEIIKDKKYVSLTFDDGPGKYTDELLEILDENDCKATFFVLGTNVKKYPDIIKKEYLAGHEIGMHGYSHTSFKKLSTKEVLEELRTTFNLIVDSEAETTILVRPPYGSITQEQVESLNFAFINWSIDTNDWKNKNKDLVKKEILENIEEGSIILMHDVHPYSIEALKELLPELKEEYEFVTISTLFNKLENDLEINNLYRKVKTKKKSN